MKLKNVFIGLLTLVFIGCNSPKKESTANETYPDVKIAGAMKNVMWKGQLAGIIRLDTIQDKRGLYGLGPQSYLTGELLIKDGQTYVSKVTSDSTMTVEKTDKVTAPFFVYARVRQWEETELPSTIKTIKDLEQFIDEKTTEAKRPFAFKLSGTVTHAEIHIQNLPEGTKVSSPEEAHQGQTSYSLDNEVVEIIGFFSTQHQGIFTHHDSFLHMHLITKDESEMGHLDAVEFEEMRLFFPKK